MIYDVIGEASNFIRVRGYTDNQAINNEIYSSNWELSVFRATAILRVLEKQGLNPARMAIEGYGQYYPSSDNLTAQGRARNRKVVVAISKYGLEKANLLNTPTIDLKVVEEIVTPKLSAEENIEQSNNIKVIRLKDGGIRITTRNDNSEDIEPKKKDSIDNDNKDN